MSPLPIILMPLSERGRAKLLSIKSLDSSQVMAVYHIIIFLSFSQGSRGVSWGKRTALRDRLMWSGTFLEWARPWGMKWNYCLLSTPFPPHSLRQSGIIILRNRAYLERTTRGKIAFDEAGFSPLFDYPFDKRGNKGAKWLSPSSSDTIDGWPGKSEHIITCSMGTNYRQPFESLNFCLWSQWEWGAITQWWIRWWWGYMVYEVKNQLSCCAIWDGKKRWTANDIS